MLILNAGGLQIRPICPPELQIRPIRPILITKKFFNSLILDKKNTQSNS